MPLKKGKRIKGNITLQSSTKYLQTQHYNQYNATINTNNLSTIKHLMGHGKTGPASTNLNTSSPS
jgi:hypothetical protein